MLLGSQAIRVAYGLMCHPRRVITLNIKYIKIAKRDVMCDTTLLRPRT